MMGISASADPLVVADIEGCLKTFRSDGRLMIDNSLKNIQKIKSLISSSNEKISFLE